MKISLKKSPDRGPIPKPTISRLCKIYRMLEDIGKDDQETISSKEIGKRIGAGSHTIRKDIGYLGEKGTSGAGYNASKLRAQIAERFGFDIEKRACIVGLGRLGTAIMNYEKILNQNFRIVAGFDSSINKLETIRTDIPVYPTYEISDVVKRENIKLAVITTPVDAAEKVCRHLIDGGVQGIINFSPKILHPPSDMVHINNIDLVDEFRFLSAQYTLDQK